MTSLLFASKIGAIGAKVLGGAALVKAAPIVVPVVCVVACVGVTVAGARYLAKKLPIPAGVIADECEHCGDDGMGTDDEE
jgi:hypothetical protein